MENVVFSPLRSLISVYTFTYRVVECRSSENVTSDVTMVTDLRL